MSKKFTLQNFILYTLVVALLIAKGAGFEGCFQRIERPGIIEIGPNDDQEKDSLTLRYIAIQDSMTYVEVSKSTRLYYPGNSMFVGPVGVANNASPFHSDQKSTDLKYYFGLFHYKISSNSAIIMKGKQYYIKTVIWDSLRGENWIGHYETRPTSVRFVTTETSRRGSYSEKPGSILIPINQGGYKMIKGLIITGIFLLVALGIYFIIILPIQILRRISIGDFFNPRNFVDIRATAIYLMGLWVCDSLVPIIFYWICSSIVPETVYFDYGGVIFGSNVLLIQGLVLLIVAKAFEKGYRLEQEQAKKFR